MQDLTAQELLCKAQSMATKAAWRTNPALFAFPRIAVSLFLCALTGCKGAVTNAPPAQGIADQAPIAPAGGQSDASPNTASPDTDPLFNGPWTPRLINETRSPIAQSSAMLPALEGIQTVPQPALPLPYLPELPSWQLKVQAEEMADTLDTKPSLTYPEYFALGPKVWSQPGRLYRAVLEPRSRGSATEAVAQVERAWVAAGATLVTSRLHPAMFNGLPLAYWPRVCAHDMRAGPACSMLRTYAMRIADAETAPHNPMQVWLQVGVHEPSSRAWISAMQFGAPEALLAPPARPLVVAAHSASASADTASPPAETESPPVSSGPAEHITRAYTRNELLQRSDPNSTIVWTISGLYQTLGQVNRMPIARFQHSNVQFTDAEGQQTAALPFHVQGNLVVVDTPQLKRLYLIRNNREIIPIPALGGAPSQTMFRYGGP